MPVGTVSPASVFRRTWRLNRVRPRKGRKVPEHQADPGCLARNVPRAAARSSGVVGESTHVSLLTN